MTRPRLFIPGPTEVAPDVLEAMAAPMIGHRSPEYRELHGRVAPKLRELLGAEQSIPLLFTSSATGVMEACIRNLAGKKVLSLVCGAFSERWQKIAESCGRETGTVEVPWGEAIRADAVREALEADDYDVVTLVHNETSTGIMNDLPAIARAVREVGGDKICLCVDTVSSMSAVPTPVDELDIDVCLAGTQKAFAVPPGLTVATISPRALERAKKIPDRGFYFDFLDAAKAAAKNQTPSTPAISLINALDVSLDHMFAEGLDNRYRRHQNLASAARSWAKQHFTLFTNEADSSITLTVVGNNQGVDVDAMLGFMKEHGIVLANGYGKLAGDTFRIGHMGECTVEDLAEVLTLLDGFLDSRN